LPFFPLIFRGKAFSNDPLFSFRPLSFSEVFCEMLICHFFLFCLRASCPLPNLDEPLIMPFGTSPVGLFLLHAGAHVDEAFDSSFSLRSFYFFEPNFFFFCFCPGCTKNCSARRVGCFQDAILHLLPPRDSWLVAPLGCVPPCVLEVTFNPLR